MKKILFVIDSLNSGGAEKSLISLLTLFDFERYEVDLLMFTPTGLYMQLLPDEVNVIDVPNFIKLLEQNSMYLIKKNKIRELYKKLGRSFSLRNPYYKNSMHSAQISWNWLSGGINNLSKKYDVAVAYSQGAPTYFVSEKVEADKKICWINTDYKKAKFNKNFDLRYYLKYDNIVAVSDDSKRVFIEELGCVKNKTSVIYDIVSPMIINQMAFQGAGFNDHFEGIRILTIGRIVDVKGYDMAIKACRYLKEDGYNFKWYAIGEGGDRTTYEKMLKKYNLEDQFKFIGTCLNPYPYLKQCDIYVQPSRFEGFGLAIAEARILHKPIVVTNFSVATNQIKNRENGLITEMNSESIYEGIKELIQNNELKEKLVEKLQKENAGTELEINKLYSIIENNKQYSMNL